MSMPVIAMPCNPITMAQAVTDLLESIALEETALSHILNAEGEKIQKVLAQEPADFCRIVFEGIDIDSDKVLHEP